MGRLIFAMNVSLDGFVETSDHRLDWATVDDEIHAWFNDLARGIDASIYGRRMYELMAGYWPHAASDPAATDTEREFAAIWRATPKVVFSQSLTTVEWESRLVRGDPGDELVRLRDEFQGDLGIGGATLAASFIRRGLVDAYRLVVHPVVLGSGTPFFPSLDTPIRLRQTEVRRFTSGAVLLAYEAA